MATPDSLKMQEQKYDDRPILEDLVEPTALIDNNHDIIKRAFTSDNIAAVNEDSLNGNSSNGSVHGSNVDGIINSTLKSSIAGAAKDVITKTLSFLGGRDDEFSPSRKVQLFSCNQQPGNEGGGFLKMVIHRGGLQVTTTGFQDDPHTLWIAHYTVDGELRQVVVFQNEQCSKMTNTMCVLHTEEAGKDQESPDYILTGKKVKVVPERLIGIDPSLAFFKQPKETGSELLFLKSLLSTEKRQLLVGFDGAGQPIPLNKVQAYSSDRQAFFKILEAG